MDLWFVRISVVCVFYKSSKSMRIHEYAWNRKITKINRVRIRETQTLQIQKFVGFTASLDFFWSVNTNFLDSHLILINAHMDSQHMEKCESIYLIDSHLCESRRESRLAWYGNPYANKGAMHRNFYFCIKKFCVEFLLENLLHKNNYIPRKQIFALNQSLLNQH